MSIANKHYANNEHNCVYNIYSNQHLFLGENNYMHVPWDDSQSDRAQVPCVETPHLGFFQIAILTCIQLMLLTLGSIWNLIILTTIMFIFTETNL